MLGAYREIRGLLRRQRKDKGGWQGVQNATMTVPASLRAAYDGAASLIGPDRAESFEVAAEVERLRWMRRPPQVRVVLLAESHVWTSPAEISSRVRQPDGVETGFARFVYCLGYGEPSLVLPSVSPNGGTPQYWKLFHDAIRGPGVALDAISKAKQREPIASATAKLALLREMNEAGIWLIDACVTALYRPGPERLVAGPAYRKVLSACWEAHVGPLIKGSSPSAVLIVGKGVDWAVGSLVRQDVPNTEVVVIEQPNARLDSEAGQNNRHTMFQLCGRHRVF
jgi:hypothetical protein